MVKGGPSNQVWIQLRSGALGIISSVLCDIHPDAKDLALGHQIPHCDRIAHMMQIFIENVKTFTGNGHYVGRSTPLGNHFPLSLGRKECIEAYRIYMLDHLRRHRNSPAYRYYDFLRKELLLTGKLHLVCHCAPLPCHADVIADFIRRGEV
jgi:hypothetical protein